MMTSEESLSDFLEESEFADTTLAGDDLFAILESLEGGGEFKPLDQTAGSGSLAGNKRQKTTSFLYSCPREGVEEEEDENKKDGAVKISHITVERNRRKQMNEHISVLRSLMPCFYVKRGDQASIIGGVVDYINELQQVLQSLEAKKQRKSYTEVLSPRVVAAAAAVQSPRPSPTVLSPRKPPLSPRPPPSFNNLHHRRLHNHLAVLPISPRTPQPPGSPYKPYSPNTTTPSSSCSSPCSNSSLMIDGGGVINELVANSKSGVADVEVKFSGAANLVLKTVSCKIPGQAVKIVAALEEMSLEILQVDIKTVDDTTLINSFTIKIGIECQLSAEELAEQIQQTFCNVQNS